MAPIDAELANSNVKPLFLFGLHGFMVSGLLIAISRFIYRSHRDTPPALHTRHKHVLHRRGLAIFTLLTILNLTLASYHALAWRYASYTNWANKSHVTVPGALWDGVYAHVLEREREGTLFSRMGVSGWQLGRWMDDTNLVEETNAASITDPTAMWWTYQNFLGLITWSIFIGIEGHHRNFPEYITAFFVLLAQLTSLSSAQNLFFISLILIPMPLVKGAPASSESPISVPHPAILSIPALVGFAVLGSLPNLIEHALFPTVISIGYFVLPLLLALLPSFSSQYGGKHYKSIAAARKSYEPEFTALSLASVAFHGYFSYKAITTSIPPHRYFRHNFVWNSHQKLSNSRGEQAWAVFIKLVSVLSDNPIVSGVGWDVLLSAISLSIWTVSHGVDVIAMLRCSCLSWTLPISKPVREQKYTEAQATKSTNRVSSPPSVDGSPVKRRGRPKKGMSDPEYRPDKATKETVDKFDVDEPSDPGPVKETEGLALAWGLYVLGGLGTLTSSVLGAEASAR